MKKISLLIALCMLLTIGGVYATWTYTGNDVLDKNDVVSMNLTEATSQGAHGEYTIDTSNLKLTIDPKVGAGALNNHTTALYYNDGGYVRVTFTPNENAPQEIKDNGLLSYFSLSLSNSAWTFDDGSGSKNIITIKHNEQHRILPVGQTEAGVMNWVKDGDSFYCDIPASFFQEHLELGEFLLDTKADYDAFFTALKNGEIIAHIGDGISATDPAPIH